MATGPLRSQLSKAQLGQVRSRCDGTVSLSGCPPRGSDALGHLPSQGSALTHSLRTGHPRSLEGSRRGCSTGCQGRGSCQGHQRPQAVGRSLPRVGTQPRSILGRWWSQNHIRAKFPVPWCRLHCPLDFPYKPQTQREHFSESPHRHGGALNPRDPSGHRCLVTALATRPVAPQNDTSSRMEAGTEGLAGIPQGPESGGAMVHLESGGAPH